MQEQDLTEALRLQVAHALERGQTLCIAAGQSKHSYGGWPTGELLSLAEHSGIISYEPTELVLTARAGTPLALLESTLASQGQMLAFEPPHWGPSATLGGTIACNFSGPARPYLGSARDFVLGCKLINGKAEVLRFGGQVMKNVAGYDVSRLMAGALGTLGVLLEVSLKVLPCPEHELTLVLEASVAASLQEANQLARLPLPITGFCYHAGQRYLRLAGTAGALKQAQAQLPGRVLADAPAFWQRLREQQLDFFHSARQLWRLSVPADAPPLDLPGKWLYDWGGAQRWLSTEAEPQQIRNVVAQAGGHASWIRGADPAQRQAGLVFHPLAPGLVRQHQRLKQAFDPKGIFNPGRLYAGL